MLLITGVTGLTGRFLIQELREAGYSDRIRCLIRSNSDISWINDPGIEFYVGNVTSTESIIEGLNGITGVIHLVNIRSSPQIINACQHMGVNRVIFINTTGIYSRYQKYSGEYKQLEQIILSSELDFTIIRPTMIYGNHWDKNIHKLVLFINRYPIVPIVTKGYGLMQPIYARDLAKAIALAYMNPVSIRKEYNVAGKTLINFYDLMWLIASILNKKRLFIRIPYSITMLAGYAGELIPNSLIDIEKVKRLQEDKVFSYELATNELGFSPISINEGIALEIASLREIGLIK